MPKYFIMPEDIDTDKGSVSIAGENADHLITTLRTRPGDEVTVCRGDCMDYICEVTDVFSGKNKRCTLKILSVRPVSEPRIKIKLYQALPKTGKMEYIIQKCVEMGIYEIVPIYTENSSVSALSGSKQTRYRKISEAAAKQSMRGFIPCIRQPVTLGQAIEDSVGNDLVFASYENEDQTSLKDILSGCNLTAISSAAFFVGSEGGFSDREADAFKNANIPRVSLGARVLRTETAGFAVLTILMYVSNELSVNRGEF